MNIENNIFFVSLFNPDSSGTILFYGNKIKIEINVKHSIYDWGDVPLTLFNIEKYPTKTVIYNWIPIRWRCQGIRINIFINKEIESID